MNAWPQPLKNVEEPIARRLAPVVRDLIVAELRRVKAERLGTMEAEIMDAAAEVGRAVDTLAQCRFTAAEPQARIALVNAAARLRRIMEKHGRMP